MNLLSAGELADHPYLFHAAIAPFLLFGDELLMGKIAAALSASAVALAVFFLLRYREVRWP